MGARLHELAYTSCLELGDTWCFQSVIGVQVEKVKLIIASISTARMKRLAVTAAATKQHLFLVSTSFGSIYV